jgi:splicing factor 3B subunit 2
MDERRRTKNEKRRQRKKQSQPKADGDQNQLIKNDDEVVESKSDPIEVEYVSADLTELDNNPALLEFKKIFEKFSNPEELTNFSEDVGNRLDPTEDKTEEPEAEVNEVTVKKLSKKKKRLMSRLSVAELKQLVQRPDVVEAHDVTSSDPRLLVFLKASRNTVPVPRHWCHKRKYLQGKRGIEKPPFQLPEFIADTGIAKIRESVLESEALKKSKQKARDKVQPRMGKIDIDYQVLHDAFFKFQTKPKMSEHGDLYYEGKEFEVCSVLT